MQLWSIFLVLVLYGKRSFSDIPEIRINYYTQGEAVKPSSNTTQLARVGFC